MWIAGARDRRGGPRLGGMSEYQITCWRDLPSLVTARDGDELAKAMLPPRFQEAIDEAAMRLGTTGADDYLAGWTRGAWSASEEDPATTCDRLVAELEATWPPAAVAAYLDDLGPAEA